MFKKFLELKNITPESFKAKSVEEQADLQNEYLGSLESEITANKSALNVVKEELKNYSTKEQFTKIDKDIEELSKSVAGITSGKGKEKSIATFEVSKNIKKNGHSPSDYDFSGVIKADVIHNLFVIDGGEFDEDEANADAAIITITAGSPRISPRQNSNLEFVNTVSAIAEPLLIGEALQAAIVDSETGTIDDVKEGNTKPVVAQKPKIQKVEATVLALVWYETIQYINRMGVFRTFVNNNVMMRYIDRLANKLMARINTLAATWSLPTGFNLVPSPNNYDVLTALAARIESFKYSPTHLIINVVDMANMFTNKGLDGHYTLSNGGSVQLVDGGTTLIINGSAIRVIKVDSNIQAVGTVTMFDVSKLRFGLSPQLRTMINPYEYWRENIVGNLMEGAYAVLLPENHPQAVVKGSFATIITALTPPPPPAPEG
jgi:hypothetical protein